MTYDEPGIGMTWSPRLATQARHSCAVEIFFRSAILLRPSTIWKLCWNPCEEFSRLDANQRVSVPDLFGETIEMEAHISLRDVGSGLDLSGQETFPERRVSDHRDAELFRSINDYG